MSEHNNSMDSAIFAIWFVALFAVTLILTAITLFVVLIPPLPNTMEKHMPQSVRETITEAINEAVIMECARDRFEEDNLLTTAMRLSGAPFSLVEFNYHETKMKKVRKAG